MDTKKRKGELGYKEEKGGMDVKERKGNGCKGKEGKMDIN